MRQLNFAKLETKTGVPLWVMSIPDAASVASGVLVKAGTRDEEWPKEAGIAHALEHMMLQGTENLPSSKDVSGYVEEVGGIINAWTWKEMTFYWNQMPVSARERSIKILSEQLRKSIFPEEKIPIEMKNIIQEIRRRNDDPRAFVNDLAEKLLYGDHPLSKDTLGLEESVSSLTREDFLHFKERYYDPVNYTFIVAGAITSQEARQLFEENFPEELKLKPNIREEQTLSTREKKLVFKRDIEQVHLILTAPLGKANDQSSKHLDIFRTMISGGMSFPLFQDVRDKRGLCYEVWADLNRWSDVGIFRVYVGTDPKRFREAIETCLEVVQEYKTNEALLNKAKNLKLGRLALRYENTADIISIAAEDIAYTGRPRGYDELKQEIEAVRIEDVEKAVNDYLQPDSFRTAFLIPSELEV